MLNNEVNRERYKIFILPSCKTISLHNLEKIKLFHDNGGVVIATSCLPEKSVETGHDKEIQSIVNHMFAGTGKGIFIPNLSAPSLKQSLEKLNINWDIEIDNVHEAAKESQLGKKYPESENMDFAFNYIHKVKNGIDVYFFSNSTDQKVTANISINTDKTPEFWNPHNGQIEAIEHKRYGKKVVINIQLGPVQSKFVVF